MIYANKKYKKIKINYFHLLFGILNICCIFEYQNETIMKKSILLKGQIVSTIYKGYEESAEVLSVNKQQGYISVLLNIFTDEKAIKHTVDISEIILN